MADADIDDDGERPIAARRWNDDEAAISSGFSRPPGSSGSSSSWGTSDPEVIEPGRPSLRGYRVARYLGGGANGMVWAVVRERDDARLAAKVLLADVDEASAELGLLSRLEHDHVLRLHDSLIDESGPCHRLVLVTDLAEGGSLSEAIRGRGHLTLGEMVTVLTPLARTLHDLHGQGLVHGDVHPGNVLLTGTGKPLLADFGQARMVCAEEAELWGTPGFVAPEMLAGSPGGPEADVYAWGALAWACLVGEPPPPAALRPHLPDVAPHADRATCDLVLSCLAHTPQARPTAGEVALAVWQVAPAEPAPVPGSAGVRAAPETRDPWSGLTQRIRDEAVPVDVEDDEDEPWHRRAPMGRIAAVAALVGLVGGAIVVWPHGEDAQPVAAVATTPVDTNRAPRPVTSAVPSNRGAPASAPTAATPTASAAPADAPDLSGRRATDVRAVVQSLANSRAAAWKQREPAALAASLLPESAAWQRDSRDLRRAADVGVRYEGLTFTVQDARVASATPATLTVEATVARSEYRVRRDAAARTRTPGTHSPTVASQVTTQPAQAAERTLLTLSRTDQGWRISDWRSRA